MLVDDQQLRAWLYLYLPSAAGPPPHRSLPPPPAPAPSPFPSNNAAAVADPQPSGAAGARPPWSCPLRSARSRAGLGCPQQRLVEPNTWPAKGRGHRCLSCGRRSAGERGPGPRAEKSLRGMLAAVVVVLAVAAGSRRRRRLMSAAAECVTGISSSNQINPKLGAQVGATPLITFPGKLHETRSLVQIFPQNLDHKYE